MRACYISVMAPGFVGKLAHWHYNTFRAEWTAEWRAPTLVTFVLNAAGQPGTLETMNARFSRRPPRS
jgi:hypothetical protein